MNTKQCTMCKEEKLLVDFYNESRVKDGKQARCKACHKLITDSYRKNNLELYANASKKYWSKLSDKAKHSKWLERYGLTAEQYTELHTAQNGCCAICNRQCISGQNLSVDHCHKTNKVRGLLCKKCNTALGMLEDNIDYLQAAIDYLRVSKGGFDEPCGFKSRTT